MNLLAFSLANIPNDLTFNTLKETAYTVIRFTCFYAWFSIIFISNYSKFQIPARIYVIPLIHLFLLRLHFLKLI